MLAFFGWQRWEKYAIEKAASVTLEEAGNLSQQLEDEPELSDFGVEYTDALASFREARDFLAAENYSSSLKSGRRSVALLSSILNALQDQGIGEAHIISLAGRVEFRRGEFGDWEEARTRVSLRDGSYLRTTRNGSAEIMFKDGTLYHVRPNTLFLVSGRDSADGSSGGQTIRMEYGWLDLSTARKPSRVATPDAEAEVSRESSASVAYNQESSDGRFAAYRGGMTVETPEGASKAVGALQEVVQSKGKLSEPQSIPRAPELREPTDNFERRQRGGRLSLRWAPVVGAEGYALQVSRNQLFVENLIEDDNRRKNTATLDVRGEGSFAWRVAAINGQGRRGPWSPSRKFRVSASSNDSANRTTEDKIPPGLSLNNVQTYGSIFIISGSTEAGAEVTVRSEPVTVEANGEFAKTLQVYDNGWSFVEVRAKDAYGNVTKRRLRLYVDNL
ncbi:MAG: FecR domain-containing protein [Deltaproteobacteria bacterium]|nr:FecR domain-containing protein [Deltaproteobacteria bacterium]